MHKQAGPCAHQVKQDCAADDGVLHVLQARKMVANVMRLVADTMPQNTLNSQQPIRSRYLEWLRETIVYLRSLPPFGEAFWEVSQVCQRTTCSPNECIGCVL